MEWNITKDNTPYEGVRVNTKIDDENGIRNEQILIYKGGRWWHKDMAMYVYYTPTHWRY